MPTDSVTVAVRLRPFNQREKNQNEARIVTIGQDGLVGIAPADDSQAGKQFSFDFSYDWDTEQDTVYTDLGQPLLHQAFEGWNGTIFAYGQTGSGKSFSMGGTKELPGMVPKMCTEIYTKIGKVQAENPNVKFLITCSFLEIYNEVLYDLLDPNLKSGTAKKRGDTQLDVKEHPQLGVYVSGLQEIPADTSTKILALIDQGNDIRAVASTAMNATSSRSHSIFIIKMMSTEVIEGQKREMRATINLVDLAGSERAAKTGATGDKLKEGANINKSLSALGAVINALAENSKGKKKVFIPYRNSKLTRVLQESLGGNSVTIMMAAISPAAYNYDETMSTLAYADRAKAIQLKAKKNEQMTEVGKLKQEIDELKALLAAAHVAGGGGAGLDAEAEARMRRDMEALQAMQQSSFEEKERIAREMEQTRAEAMAKQERLRRAQREKYEQERAIILQSGTSEWVPLLLRSSRAAAKHISAAADTGGDTGGGGSADAVFVARVEALEAARKAAAEDWREHSAFLAVLQSALAKEATIFLQKEASRGVDSEDGEGKADFADDMGSKVLMEQILLKMKNLREELSKGPALKETVMRPLAEMADAAAAHVVVPREALAALLGGGGEAEEERERLELQASDVELLGRQADRERARVEDSVEASRALEPLKMMAEAVRGGVEVELAQVEVRQAADGVDEAQKAGMEKRAAVLHKELHVLRDILAREELAKVVQGVVVRTGKRMTMRDKAKDKTLAAREQQAEKLKKEMEEMRESLFSENASLKEERSQMHKQLDELKSAVAQRDGTITALITQVETKDAALADIATTDPDRVAAAQAAAQRTAEAAAAKAQAAAAEDGGADDGAFSFNIKLNLAPDEGGGGSAVLNGKLQLAASQLGETQASLRDMTERAKKATEARRAMEEELAPLRKRNEALEKQLRAIVDSPQLQAIAKSGIASVMRDERSAAPVARRAGAPGTSKPGSMLVAVPEGVEPGKQMTITSKSGKALLITVPEGMAPGEQMEVSVPLTPVPGERVSFAVPDGVRPGDQLSITAPSGREMTVTVPEGSVPGQELEVDVPADGPPPAERVSFQVPAGVGPGDSVTITAPDGREVTVTMPEGALAGATIEVELPPVDDGIQGLAELLAGTTTTLAAAPSPGPEARRAAGSDGFDSAKEALSLELASAQQRASRQEGALADMSLQLQKYEAQVKFLQISKGEMEAIAAGSGADVAGVSGLQLRLQAAQAEATEAAAALRAVRETELPQEQARAMALKQEVFRLKEAALTSEEAMLELQDELHELRQQVLESKEKLYAAEMASEQQRLKLKEAQGLDVGAVRSLQDEVAALKQKNDSRGAEIEEMEAEKYTMAEDIENLQEELEDANRQQKKYYEALMAKDEQVRSLKGTCKQLQKVVERLQYEADLKDLQVNAPTENIGPGYEEMEALVAAQKKKDAELAKLKAELERVTATVVDEEDFEIGGRSRIDEREHEEELYGQPTRGSLLKNLQRGGTADDDGRGGPVADGRTKADLGRARAQLGHADAARADLEARLARAEAVAAQAQRAAAAAEADRRAQEAEALKLLRAKDEFDAATALKEEELQEMNDQLYEKSTLLEEAEEKAAGAVKELAQLQARLEAERRDGAAAVAARRGLEEELASEREEKEKLQRLLKQAIG